MNPLYALLLLNGLLFAAGWLFSVADHQILSQYVFVALSLLVIWQFLLYTMVVSPVRAFRIRASFRTHHYVQTSLQLCLYFYWGLYWREVGNYVPLLITQLIFAYLFEMLLSWSRGKEWHVGFGQFPVVLSLNLFLWFGEEYFYLQFLLVALTYLGKEFVTWTQDGKRKHIFNPSGLSLSLVSVGLMFTGAEQLTRGVDIITAFVLTPSFYEVVFLLGLVVMLLFRTTLVTFGCRPGAVLVVLGGGECCSVDPCSWYPSIRRFFWESPCWSRIHQRPPDPNWENFFTVWCTGPGSFLPTSCYVIWDSLVISTRS